MVIIGKVHSNLPSDNSILSSSTVPTFKYQEQPVSILYLDTRKVHRFYYFVVNAEVNTSLSKRNIQYE